MDSRQPPPSTFLPSTSDISGAISGTSGIRPPEKFNFDLSDLIDDLISLTYTESGIFDFYFSESIFPVLLFSTWPES